MLTTNNLLAPSVDLIEIKKGIYTTNLMDGAPQEYDQKAAFYDRLVGNRFYNQLMWGTRPMDYTTFAQMAVRRNQNGPILDVGCGALTFTAIAYSKIKTRPIILMDNSIKMLELAKERLEKENGQLPSNILLIQGDVFQLPFRTAVFDTVTSFGLYHLFPNGHDMIRELKRVLKRYGDFYFTSLVTDRKFGAFYLRFLKKMGQIGAVRSGEEVASNIEQHGLNVTRFVKGNMVFIEGIG